MYFNFKVIFKKIKFWKVNYLTFYLYFYNFLIANKYLIKSKKINNNDSNIILVNFKNRQPKLNFTDLKFKKTFIYSLGLILDLSVEYKKSVRRNILMLKYLINFLLKNKLNSLITNSNFLVFKGFRKSLVKLIYNFKYIFTKLKVDLFLIKPLKSLNLTGIKKTRSIKRRVYKKLVKFNNM